MAFSVIEPHPSVGKAKKANLSTGRGGAGNFSSHESSSLTSGPTATGPASRFSISSSTSKHSSSASKEKPAKVPASTTPKAYSGGIGGAGNFHSASDRRMFSFDEELERAQRMEDAKSGVPVYHFGRGGAGNRASTVTDKQKSASARASSTSSSGSSNSNVTESSTESRGTRRGLGTLIRGLSSGSRE